MTTRYELWPEVEAIDEDRDHYQTIPLICGAITTMESMQDTIELAESITRTQQEDLSGEIIQIPWAVKDILQQRPDLTNEQAKCVLQQLAQFHDASIGINWDVIDEMAEELFPEPSNESHNQPHGDCQ